MRLYALVRDDDTEAAELVESLRGTLHDRDSLARLGRVADALADYDFERALEAVRDLARGLAIDLEQAGT